MQTSIWNASKLVLLPAGTNRVLGVNNDMDFSTVVDLGTAKVIIPLARIWGMPELHNELPNTYVKEL